MWMVAGFAAALCLWNVFFDYNCSYGAVTTLVIPGVIMAHIQFFAGGYRLKQVAQMALSWLAGCLVRPFSAIPMLGGAAAAMVSGRQRQTARRAGLGALLAGGMLAVILPLLGSADQVFGYYIRQLLGGLDPMGLLVHLLLALGAAALAYSLLWNAGFGEQKGWPAAKAIQIDQLVTCIVLGAVVAVYLLFCTVQFTYLFAGAGLPEGITYSHYAREGFAQIVLLCAINLLVFGVFLHYGPKSRATTALLAGLLAATMIMLVSGFVRLRLYIQAYGLTWLRLLSGWFILYLGAVLVLCGVRMVREKLPLIAVCAFVLLGWYVVLGYANPEALTLGYNLRANAASPRWVQENSAYVSGLSDDGILVLQQMEIAGTEAYITWRAERATGYSLASRRLRGAGSA